MKVHLIYSNKDQEAIEQFLNHTYLLRRQGKLEFVELGDAEVVLLFGSAALLEDVFCYQAFVVAEYKGLKIIPVLMNGNWDWGKWKKEFSHIMASHLILTAPFQPNGFFIYNSSTIKNRDPDEGWTEVAKWLYKFIEEQESK